MRLTSAIAPALALLAATACSSTSEPDAADAGTAGPVAAVTATTTSTHRFAKYIELSGFRLSEVEPGTLRIRLAAINHSEADFGDVTLKVRLLVAGAEPSDPPIAEFEVQVPEWGPEGVKDVSATAPSTLRVYELPDWQFLRADFDILLPPD